MPENYFVCAHIQSIINYGSTLWDSESANTLKPLVSLHKKALKAILKSTTRAISEYNFLSILPLKLSSDTQNYVLKSPTLSYG